jgi:uncharacterized protein (TIGR00730 family)
MPVIRISGTVAGRRDPSRKVRAKLLYRLFEAGWNIYNGNGDQEVHLGNVQKKIRESDAFVYPPGATLQDMFNAASTSVGVVTNDPDIFGKRVTILNSDYSWDGFVEMLEHLQELGTIGYHHEVYFDIVKSPKKVVAALEESYQNAKARMRGENVAVRDDSTDIHVEPFKDRVATKPDFRVCVFCSASVKKQQYLDAGYALGKSLADNGWGCVSGAGCTGIMGKVVEGTGENGGWAGGSNIPHIIALEGHLPEGLSEFWPRDDIYTRMEVMIEESNAFVIMPGGIGTVQEVLALIIMKQQHHPIMRHKSIVVVNQDFGEGKKFWSPLIRLLNAQGAYDMFHVVDHVDDVIDKLKELEGTK